MNSMSPSVITPADLALLADARPATVLLDVRTPGEFAVEHISGALNVPLAALDESETALLRAEEKPVVSLH